MAFAGGALCAGLVCVGAWAYGAAGGYKAKQATSKRGEAATELATANAKAEGATPRECWRLVPQAGSISNMTLCSDGEFICAPHQGHVQIQVVPLSSQDGIFPPQAQQQLLTQQVHAVGLNFADVFAVQGLYSVCESAFFSMDTQAYGRMWHTHTQHKHRTHAHARKPTYTLLIPSTGNAERAFHSRLGVCR